jgi:hypothetical protein
MITGAMLTITVWCLLVILEAVITKIKCEDLGGVMVQGKCMTQMEAFKSIERWPNWGGWNHDKKK